MITLRSDWVVDTVMKIGIRAVTFQTNTEVNNKQLGKVHRSKSKTLFIVQPSKTKLDNLRNKKIESLHIVLYLKRRTIEERSFSKTRKCLIK